MAVRRRIRAVFFWIHLTIGVLAGALILLMSATGVLLGFERQMIAWIDGAPRIEATGAAPLPLDSVLARAGVVREGVASVIVRRDPTQPVTIRLREDGAPPVLAHPVTGAVLRPAGDGSGQRAFAALRRWHRYVGAEAGALRDRMKLVNGVANLVFLGLVLSGLYLWWPRRWSVARLKATAVPQLTLRGGHARDFNWHNSLGFWFAIPLALIVATGAFFSFRWPGQYLDLALGSATERTAARAALAEARSARTEARGGTGRPRESRRDESSEERARPADAALAQYVAAAVAARPAWAQLTITLPDAEATETRVVVAEGNTYRPDQRWTLELARETGAVVTNTGYADLSTARQLRAWVRFGHTGEVFGIPGQLVATLASAVGVLLVLTGFALTGRRFRQALIRRRRAAASGVTRATRPLDAPVAAG
ncbi:MAG: PepSY domain-containing protein [Gemmatimonadaceae bacterium]|jgi:uncharacterized iron-regulated membrane protein|nr:PepSY domain-containing protein [Gemmatimonadaceae bacterium]